MGYRPPRKTATLTFKGDLEGLVAEVKTTSVGAYLNVLEAAALPQKIESMVATPEQTATFVKNVKTFTELLISWNLEDVDGSPVPPTFDGMLSQEPWFVKEVLVTWMNHYGVRTSEEAEPFDGTPLAQNSTAGLSFSETNLPMEVS